jgi:hypothetical protein
MNNPDKLMTRKLALQFVNEVLGVPMGSSTFSKICAPAINEGPTPDCWFGKRPLYSEQTLREWAQSLMRPQRGAVSSVAPPKVSADRRDDPASPIAGGGE